MTDGRLNKCKSCCVADATIINARNRASLTVAAPTLPHLEDLPEESESPCVFTGEFPRVRLRLTPLDVFGMRGSAL